MWYLKIKCILCQCLLMKDNIQQYMPKMVCVTIKIYINISMKYIAKYVTLMSNKIISSLQFLVFNKSLTNGWYRKRNSKTMVCFERVPSEFWMSICMAVNPSRDEDWKWASPNVDRVHLTVLGHQQVQWTLEIFLLPQIISTSLCWFGMSFHRSDNTSENSQRAIIDYRRVKAGVTLSLSTAN